MLQCIRRSREILVYVFYNFCMTYLYFVYSMIVCNVILSAVRKILRNNHWGSAQINICYDYFEAFKRSSADAFERIFLAGPLHALSLQQK